MKKIHTSFASMGFLFYIRPYKKTITMENPTLLQMYEHLLDEYTYYHNLTEEPDFYDYICKFINFYVTLDISNKDRFRLLDHFNTQRPSQTQYTEIYNNPLCVKNPQLRAWFNYGEGYIEIRKQLLQEIIKKLKEENFVE